MGEYDDGIGEVVNSRLVGRKQRAPRRRTWLDRSAGRGKLQESGRAWTKTRASSRTKRQDLGLGSLAVSLSLLHLTRSTPWPPLLNSSSPRNPLNLPFPPAGCMSTRSLLGPSRSPPPPPTAPIDSAAADALASLAGPTGELARRLLRDKREDALKLSAYAVRCQTLETEICRLGGRLALLELSVGAGQTPAPTHDQSQGHRHARSTSTAPSSLHSESGEDSHSSPCSSSSSSLSPRLLDVEVHEIDPQKPMR